MVSPVLQEVRPVPQFLTEGDPPQNCSLQREVPCGETALQEGNPAAGDCEPVRDSVSAGEGGFPPVVQSSVSDRRGNFGEGFPRPGNWRSQER
ncbi:hypothetical protein BZZ01_02790 [Nostocales cyanobacterium HT-58-2]|nr:hypothetical protein BZZ01_02790 [Nostocales cyanobacterium HT-58-2]